LNAIQFSYNYWQPSTNTTNIEIGYLTKVDAAGRTSAELPRVLLNAASGHNQKGLLNKPLYKMRARRAHPTD